MKRFFFLLFLAGCALFISGCAQGPDSGSSFSGSAGGGATKDNLVFLQRINDSGRINTGGSYVILLNAQVQAIEVTNPGTYTDAIKFYYDPNLGPSYAWLHRIPSVPGPGYDFVSTARLDEYAQVSSDFRSISYTFKLNDASVIFNQYISNRFTAQAITTDTYQNAILGRVIDAMGPGPDITHNEQYTVFVDKSLGVISPQPPSYPQDPLFDWVTHGDLPSDYPYANFDLESLQINVY
jgi:hypothetical protein